jgi:predicted O-methyltransferase YrrM
MAASPDPSAVSVRARIAAFLFAALLASTGALPAGEGASRREGGREGEAAGAREGAGGGEQVIQTVIDELDKLCRERTIFMIGPEKARRLAELVREKKPLYAVECGTAIGYSALWIARELRAAGRGRLVTIELDPRRAAEARGHLQRAGLEDIVEVRAGDAREVLKELAPGIDFLFLDCNFENYAPCLRAAEPKLAEGALLVADNAGAGAAAMADYLAEVRARHQSRTEWFDIDLPWGKRDAMEISIFRGAAGGRIRPWAENPRFWELGGRPILLLGGSKDDNIFQLPDLDEHLAEIQAAGGNYVRNTMSDRPDKGFEVYPFLRLDDGRYDLGRWNDDYWRRFERLLSGARDRGIVVQIEVWDRFDYADHAAPNWKNHPYNPENNVNYTAAESKLAATYPNHPGRNENLFFFTVPALDDNTVVRRYQEAQVDKMLSIALDYGNVLYCIDNETSGRAEWPAYWAERIRRRAAERGVEVHVTEMWDSWDPKAAMHRQTYDHPELYSFVDVSQNNHNRGQAHWDNLQWVLAYLREKPRPLNTVKIYGADTGRYGSARDGEERFWRNIFGGAAATRFHRPSSGLGLDERAKAHLRSLRLFAAEFDFFRAEPDAESRLISARQPNEAYLTLVPGRQYAVYFPDGGEVVLDLSGAEGSFGLRWLDIAAGRWEDAGTVQGGSKVPLQAPGKGHRACLLSRRPAAAATPADAGASEDVEGT